MTQAPAQHADLRQSVAAGLRTPQRRTVALLSSESPRIARGVARYARSRADWSVLLARSGPDIVRRLGDAKVHGLIGSIEEPWLIDFVREHRLAAVNVGSAVETAGIVTVRPDDREIGQSAAAHFIERGFTSFAYFGPEDTACGRLRYAGFRDAIVGGGFGNPAWYECRREREIRDTSAATTARLARWLEQRPHPVAVLACDDAHAHLLMRCCSDYGLRLPGQVAILGVGDDELYGELGVVPCSSVDSNLLGVGQRAAEVLESLMAGHRAPPSPILVPPVRVVARQSTEALHFDDWRVAKAVFYLREHASAPISIDDVAEAVGISRRALERRFRHALGCSPLQKLLEIRLAEVQRLLKDTDMPLARIADRCGFSDASYLSRMFSRRQQISPSAYRRQFRIT